MAVEPVDCNAWKGRPGPACEGLELTRKDCEAMVTTLRPAVARRVFDCALAQTGTTALCDFPLAECLKDELDAGARAGSDPTCGTIAAECASRRERQMQAPSARGVIRWPWLLSERECRAAFAAVQSDFRAELGGCLSDSCHPTACFSGSPISLVARRARAR